MKKKLHIVLLLVLIVGWAWLEQSTKNTNWNQTFFSSHKIPYGTYILKEKLENSFSNIKVKENNKSFYELMGSSDSTCTGACMIIITKNLHLDSLSLSKMNDFIDNGNTVFISAHFLSSILLPEHECTLGFSKPALTKYISKLSISLATEDTLTEYSFNKMGQIKFFKISKNTKIKILGEENGKPCFIEISRENGKLFLHLQPLAFTNYHILYNNHEYASQVMSLVLPGTNKIIWDNYHNSNFTKNTTPLKIILSKPALRSSLYFALILLFIYIIIFAKRKQKIIPILQPPVNLSLGFIDTIGRLYFQNGNHKDIVEKQFTQLNYFIRKNFFISHIENRDEFFESLSLKAGVNKRIISDIYNNYQKLSEKKTVTEHELHVFNNQIKRFHKIIKQRQHGRKTNF